MPKPDVVRRHRPAPSLLCILLTGCASAGAPDIELAGAYFPAWLICAVLGIIGGVVARILLVITHLAERLPHQLAVCAGLGLIVAVGTWLLFFR
jgi:hypothetical protein